MNLSFREMIVLRLVAVEGTTARDSVKAAQEWADTCCLVWGHNDEFSEDEENESPDGCIATCRRCGRIEFSDWDEDK